MRLAAIKTLSPEAMKGAAMLAAACAVVVAVALVLGLWLSGLSEQQRLQQAEYDLIAARAAKKQREGASRLTAADDPARMFLSGDTPGLVFAGFQTIVGEVASRSGLSVKRMQPMEGESGGSTYRLGVEAEGGLEQLRAFLTDIEQQLPVMTVTGLEVRPLAAPGTGDEFPSEQLRIGLRIEARSGSSTP